MISSHTDIQVPEYYSNCSGMDKTMLKLKKKADNSDPPQEDVGNAIIVSMLTVKNDREQEAFDNKVPMPETSGC
jgi:hypothetical protein